MKAPIFFALGLVVAAATVSAVEEKSGPDTRATVTYVAPEKFTDFTSSGFGSASEKEIKYLTGIFTDHIENLAKRYLAADERLEITFKDIDLAGRYEPERGPRMQDVRIFRDITFPRMNLTFQLLGPDGHVRAEGDRKLIDMNCNMNIMPPTGDPEFRYDKALLSDWMAKEFKKKKT